MIDRRYLIVLVIVLGIIPGCVGALNERTEMSTPTATHKTADNGDRAPSGRVYLEIRDFMANESNFYLKADVDYLHPLNETLPETTFEGVVLCLYTSDGSVLNSTIVGDLEAPDGLIRNVEISSQELPKYVVVDHPRFRTYGEIIPDVLIRYDDKSKYSLEGGSLEYHNPSFPYPRHNQTGECM